MVHTFLESTYKGKQVWEIQEIPYNICETGIIIGINPVIWSEIESSLRGSGITNYICPFLMKELFATIRLLFFANSIISYEQ